MIFRKQLLDIIDYAYEQAHDSEICVCPTAVPNWDDRNLTDEVVEHQLHSLRVIRKYIEEYDTNRRYVHPNTIRWLVSRFMDTEYSEKLLADVSVHTFNTLKQDLMVRFEELSFTEDDVKGAWKEWFDWAASNGTLISPHIRIKDAERPYMHDEIRVIDTLLTIAYAAIDKL